MIKTINLAAGAVMTMIGAAWALDLASTANAVVDQAQPSAAEWIGTTVSSAVMIFATWLGRVLGIKVVEYFNREAIARAAGNFANSVIDELQLRYLRAGPAGPDLHDLIITGAEYVTSGSQDAVKESGIRTDRIKVIVEGALKDRAKDLLAAQLRASGIPGVVDAR